MDNYLDIAGDPIFYIAALLVIGFVLVQSTLFLVISFKRGREAGLSAAQMRRALRAGATTGIIPALPVVVALIAIAPVLGVPIPWMRLSVIGSAPYELMAAGIGAKTMGIDTLGGAGYDGTVFANSVWVMCVGSFWSIAIVTFLYKFIRKRYAKSVQKDAGWRPVLTGACFMGVFALFMADPLTTGGLPLATFLSGAVIMVFILFLIQKFKLKTLREFALTLSMLGALGASLLFARFLG